jgi:RHS repeat-associated protein
MAPPFLEPRCRIHYKDAQGHWQPIDNTLIADTSDAGYAYGNRANGWHIRFAAQSGGPNLVHAKFPTVTTAETLDGAASVPATTTGSTVVYAGVFPGVNLLYTVGLLSLEETLLLQNEQTPTSYTFTYHVPGASATQDAAGNIVLTDAQGKVLLVIGGVLMYEADAQGQMASNAALSEKVQATLSGTGPNFKITYTPDQAWLSDPTRHFPVAIDPTSTWQGNDHYTNTTSGNIYGDTIDESGNPSSLFYNLNTLRIGNADNAGLCCNGTSRAYLKFPINPPPGQVRVTSADLALYQASQHSGGGVQIKANAIMTAWNETTLTWNNHPTSFELVGTGTTAATQNNWVHINVSAAAQEWWSGGITLNGIELQYSDESQPQELFYSDDNSDPNHPLLTINYVQDTTTPGGGLSFNGGVTATNNPAVTVAPAGSDTGSTQEWSSDWNTVNGVGTTTDPAASWSVDGTHAQLIADSSSCGSSLCFATTFFTHTLNINNWPTITAAVKADNMTDLNLGVVSSSNMNTRFDLTTYLTGSTTAFTKLEVSTAASSYSVRTVSVPFTTNTWYYVQIVFPLPNAGELYVWPVGQVRPSTPSAAYAGLYMTNPGLYVMQQGDNGANLHHVSIGNVQMTSKAASGTGYGIYGMQLSSDGTTYGCPNYAGGAFSGGPWCVYSGQSFPWTFSAGDGIKKLWWKYIDNVGNVTSSFSQVILDTTAPTVSSITLANGNPAQGSEIRGVVTLAVNGSDPPAADGSFSGLASALLYVDGVQMGTGVTGASTPTLSLDTTNLSPGVHTLTAKLIDAAGNTGAVGGSTQIIVSNTALMPYETLAKRTLPDGQTDVSVNVANGDAVVTHQDVDVSGRGPDLALGRTYHALTPQNSLFGFGWTSDLDESLTINADGSRTYRDADGGIHIFLPNGSGGYLTSPGLYLTLVQNGDGTYTLKARDQSKVNFTVAGLLSSIVDRNGNTLSVTYNGLLPATVTDAAGRQYTLTMTNGHVTQMNAPGSRVYAYGYDGNGNLTTYTDPAGVVTRYDYDGSHRMTKITLNDLSGGAQDQQTNVATTLTYDTNNRLVQLVDPMGFDVGMSYTIPSDGTGMQTLVKQLKDPTTSPATYENTQYLITSDGLGAVAKLTDAVNYDPNTPLHNPTQYLYYADESMKQVTDPDGHVTAYTYDSNGNRLTQVVDPNPGSGSHLVLTTTWTYDSSNNVVTETDPRGIMTKYIYDTPNSITGNVTQIIRNYISGQPINDPAAPDVNIAISSTYDSYGEVLTTADPRGIVTKYTYDIQGDVLTTTANYVSGGPTDSQTNVQTSATYDVLGEMLTSTEPAPVDPIPQYVVTQYGYDILGHVLQKKENYSAVHGANEGGLWNLTTTMTYDALGRPLTTTNPRGYVTKTDYDADGRTLDVIQNYMSGGPQDVETNVKVMAATYDAAGNTLTQTDAAYNTPAMNTPGHISITTYDLDDRTVQVKVQDNHKDSSGNPAPNTLSNSATKYDVAGLITEQDTLKADNTIQFAVTYTYDGAGRQATQTDPPAVVPDPGGSDPTGVGNVTMTSYDADGNVLEVKMTNSRLSSAVSDAINTFDKLNRPLTKTEQANTSSAQTTTYAYDLGGRQTSVTDPTGKTTTSAYDALGRVLTVTYPDSTQDTYTYYPDGEQKTKVNSAGTTSDSYDVLGRLLSVVSGNPQTTASYTYDANGNKLTELDNYPGGTSTNITWTYDSLDRQKTMNDGIRSFTYDVNGNVTQMVVNVQGIGNAVEADTTYDGTSQLATLIDKVGATGSILHSYGYQYDLLGNRTQITEDGTTTTYQYDQLNQLTKVTQGTTTITYKYDANNNRISMQNGSGTTTYTYDAADVNLVSKTDPNGKVTTYTYDLVNGKSNGNLVQSVYDPGGTGHLNQATIYTYDTNNRLKTVQLPNGTIITFAYDADGNRVSKAVTSGSTTTTVLDVYAQGRLVYQTDANNTKIASFNYDRSGIPESVDLTTSTGIVRYYYVYNGHGDVVALVDTNGSVKASYSYDEFGVLKTSSETFPNNTYNWTNPYRYDGAERVRYDSETGLYWMSVRAYDPTLGRFITHDPLGRLAADGDDPQPYVYAENNSVNRTDPTGQRPTDLCNTLAVIACLFPPIRHQIEHVVSRGKRGPRSVEYIHNYTFQETRPRPPGPLALLQMAINNFSTYFPFSGCGKVIRTGKTCVLNPGWSPILVLSITNTSFTFLSLRGHLEGPNRLITFSFHTNRNGLTYMNVWSRGPWSAIAETTEYGSYLLWLRYFLSLDKGVRDGTINRYEPTSTKRS